MLRFKSDDPVLEYFPFANGIYDLSPAVGRLTWSPSDARKRFFQIDHEYPKYLANKVAGKAERLAKYIQEKDLDPALKKSVAAWIIETLRLEYPLLAEEYFAIGKTYTLEELCMLVPDDLAIVSTEAAQPERKNWISFLALFSPGHWAAEDKIGLDFRATHAPVAGIERVVSRSAQLIEAMISKGPFERFVWGFSNDTNLNHHPENASRALQVPEGDGPLYMRVERQVLVSMPDFAASVFLIRTYVYDLRTYLRERELRDNLKKALLSMTPESRKYKGVAHCFDDLVAWLN